MKEVPAEVIFAQKLASNEKDDRDKAVRRLKKWFYSRSSADANSFTEDELMRIWKGLFYCYWQSDKPLIQEELAESMSSMIEYFATEESSLLFFKTFLLTMGREWFGIDHWRMNKYMMLIRRFVRQIFKYNKKHDWRMDLAEKICQLFTENLLLCEIRKTSLGLQMHTTDVFMEELAKVGTEELDSQVINAYLQPFYKVLTTCRESRLISHVHETVFNYLLRQSDIGIEWDVKKDVQELKHFEILDEKGEDLEYADEKVKENGDEGEDEIEDENAEDPRAGLVNVEIPQLQVDYLDIADKLFDLGSQNTIRASNRKVLYKLSKHFKDVGNGIFPLGDALSDDEEIPKYNVDESVQELHRIEEIIKKRNLKGKAEARKMAKKNKRMQIAVDDIYDEEGGDGDKEDLENGMENGMGDDSFDEDNGSVKRKLDEDDYDVEQSPEAKKAKTSENKQRKKEIERKRKQEQKKRKREKLLEESLNQIEEKRKVDSLIDRDLEIKAVAADDNKENNKPQKKVKKLSNGNVNGLVNGDHGKIKKKKDHMKAEEKKVNGKTEDKASKLDEEESQSEVPSSHEINTEGLNGMSNSDPKEKKKKKKKSKKAKNEKENNTIIETISKPIAEQRDNDSLPEKKSKKKKKKDKKLKEANILYKPDESNSSSKKEKKDKKLSKQKCDKKIIAEANVEKQTDETQNKKSSKLFAEPSDWDEPYQPGDQEIAKPSKKHKDEEKVKPVKSCSNGFKEFDSATVTTPKPQSLSHTAKFLKKAMSKSATPKKKLSQIGKLKAKGTSSESRIKRVNFALTKNMMQDVEEMHAQIKLSPAIPHDPKKAPEKSLLKRTLAKKAMEREGSPQLNPVSLNTQLNSVSKKGKKLHGKNMRRMMAKEFF